MSYHWAREADGGWEIIEYDEDSGWYWVFGSDIPVNRDDFEELDEVPLRRSYDET